MTRHYFLKDNSLKCGFRGRCKECEGRKFGVYKLTEDEAKGKTTKICNKCKRMLPADLNHFYETKSGQLGLNGRCKECRGAKFGSRNVVKAGKKRCYKCNEYLPLDDIHFHKGKNRKDGFNACCKKCQGQGYGVKRLNMVYKTKEGYKFCSKCKEEKPLDDFSNNVHGNQGRDSNCRKCNAERANQYYSIPENRNRKLAYDAEYRSRPETKRKIKEYYAGRGREKAIERSRIRRNRKRNAMYNYPNGTWENTLEHFNHECAYCGDNESKLHREHIVPLVDGGSFTKQNIIPACQRCNYSKNKSDMIEWYSRQPYFSQKRLNKIRKWSGMTEHSQQLSIL